MGVIDGVVISTPPMMHFERCYDSRASDGSRCSRGLMVLCHLSQGPGSRCPSAHIHPAGEVTAPRSGLGPHSAGRQI